ncbi:MAG: hypothetical protein H0X30_21840 [Anaerolineae bacterium]|nr:hypothetical protein [Anaerolineae bacterium]
MAKLAKLLATRGILPRIASGSSHCLSEKRALKRTVKLAKLAILAKGIVAANFAKQNP